MFALAAPPSLRGQGLGVTEVSAGGVVVLAHQSFEGVELGVGRRPGGQGRFALALAGGDYDGSLGVRVGAGVQFLLKPAERGGASPYGGLGLVFRGAAGAHGSGYLTALLGIESAPGVRRGWYAELQLGGGVRLAAGRRWRWFPAWW